MMGVKKIMAALQFCGPLKWQFTVRAMLIFYSQVIQTIWHTIFDTCYLHNQDLHSPAQHSQDQIMLHHQVQSLLHHPQASAWCCTISCCISTLILAPSGNSSLACYLHQGSSQLLSFSSSIESSSSYTGYMTCLGKRIIVGFFFFSSVNNWTCLKWSQCKCAFLHGYI